LLGLLPGLDGRLQVIGGSTDGGTAAGVRGENALR
jgi:hypothetical protein